MDPQHSSARRTPGPEPRRRHAGFRVGFRPVVALVVLNICGAQALHPQTSSLEYRVKAAFLYNFTRFLEWPGEAAPGSGEAFDVCVLGKDPFGRVLEKTVQGKTVRGHPLRLLSPGPEGDLEACEVIFISSSEKKRLRRILDDVRPYHALTVGETDDFLDRGGMINFLIEDGTVRFEINLDRTKEAGIKVSSQLLRLATTVRTSEGP